MRHVLPVVLIASCGVEREVWEPEPESWRVEVVDIPLPYRPALDILFVVDSAPSMAGERDAMRDNAARLMDGLEQFPHGAPDVHIGVVDSNLGTLGIDVGDARCTDDGRGGQLETFGCDVTGDFLADERDDWGQRSGNYRGTLPAAVACMLSRVGASGCPWRQPFEAMRRALDAGATNGFLRDDALLLVIFIGDADDCSAADPALYGPSTPGDPRDPFRCFARGVACAGVDDPSVPGPRTACVPRADDPTLTSLASFDAMLDGMKRNPTDVAVAAIMPAGDVVVDPGPVLRDGCNWGPIAGTPATRMRAFMEQRANRNTYTSICDDEWTDILGFVEDLAFARPIPIDEEARRIHDHLAGVEAELRAVDTRALGAARRVAREARLDELARYRDARRFPRNYDTSTRTPVFVDRHGTRCAMADLIEHAGGSELVASVAASRNLAYVPELADVPALTAWLERNGLAVAEAARIQPSYEPRGIACLNARPIDLDPSQRGLQLQATAWVRDTSGARPDQTLPACGDTLPCYRIENDPVNCPEMWTSGVSISVEPPYLRFRAMLHAEIAVE